MGIIAHAPALAPPTLAMTTDHAKLIVLVVAVFALTVVAWAAGVSLAFPVVGDSANALSQRVTSLFTCLPDDSVGGRLVAFIILKVFVAPLFCFPLILVAGVILKFCEDWPSVMDGALHIAGNIFMIPLGSGLIPTTVGGKVADFLVSSVGVGAFGLLVAFFGALPFVADSTRLLGGQKEGPLAAVVFALFFFFIVMPLVCGGFAIPLAGLIATVEDWTFVDSWLFAISVMVQSPGLVPSTLPPIKSDGGKLALFAALVWGICLSAGWGVGVIGASAGLNLASEHILAHFEGASAENAKSADGEHMKVTSQNSKDTE